MGTEGMKMTQRRRGVGAKADTPFGRRQDLTRRGYNPRSPGVINAGAGARRIGR